MNRSLVIYSCEKNKTRNNVLNYVFVYQRVKVGWFANFDSSAIKKLLLEADPDWQHVLTYVSEVKIFVISNDRRDVIAELCLLQRGMKRKLSI